MTRARGTRRFPKHMKGSCLSRIRSTAETGGTMVSKVSGFVEAHPQEAVNLTISEMAARAGTSVATVSRFCARLGYENYRAFQIDLAAALAESQAPGSDLFGPGDKPAAIIERVFEMNRRSLADTEALLDHEQVTAVAKLMMRARRVFLIGIGDSGLTAKSAALRFGSLGISAHAIADPYEGVLLLSSAGREDVVIGISHTGRTAVTTRLLQLAASKGARSVGITNYADSMLAKLSEFTLLTSFRERRVNAAVSSSAVAQMCLLDVIYFLTAYYQGAQAERLAAEIERVAENLLRARSSR